MKNKRFCQTRPEECLERVNAAINHVRDFAPNAPLERFLAQEIAQAKADAFQEAYWPTAAQHFREAVVRLGEMDIETRLALRKAGIASGAARARKARATK